MTPITGEARANDWPETIREMMVSDWPGIIMRMTISSYLESHGHRPAWTANDFLYIFDKMNLEKHFTDLASEWEEQSAPLSSPEAMADLPSYQAIISLGDQAVPLVLKRLQEEPHHWFFALMTITNENPVPQEDAGQIDKMAAAWIEWGKQKGHID